MKLPLDETLLKKGLTFNIISAQEIIDQVPADKLQTLALDLLDMNMLGKAIRYAFVFCMYSIDDFIKNCAERNQAMVEYVNRQPDVGRVVRQHGEQRGIEPLDAAMQKVINDAKEKAALEQLNDEDAAVISGFFRMMLVKMIESANKSNDKLLKSEFNLNIDNGRWGKFAIFFAGVFDAKGERIDIVDESSAAQGSLDLEATEGSQGAAHSGPQTFKEVNNDQA